MAPREATNANSPARPPPEGGGRRSPSAAAARRREAAEVAAMTPTQRALLALDLGSRYAALAKPDGAR